MPVPTGAEYAAAALIAAHTSFLNLIDGGTGAGSMKIRDSGDVLLAELPLNVPSGTVNGTTGQLVFNASGVSANAVASGTAAYAEFCDGSDVVYLALPTQAGTSAVSNKAVLNSLTTVAGSPVAMISATIG